MELAMKNAVKRLQLKNGLAVLLIENHKSPVVSVQMWVKTGSADERKGEEGISHFIEHLVFKGTEKYGVGEIASTVEASGGELNAYTSFDQTVFYVNISREFSDVALDTISEMMGFPQFDKKEIDNEREVVIEEIKRSNDSPGRQGSRLLFSTVYKSHPYGIPVIGYDKIINKVTRKTLVDYYQSRYVPKNMHLVVSGDFNSKEMSKQIAATFGRLKPFKVRKVKRKTEPAQTKPRFKLEVAPFEEAQFHLAWRIPGASHKDIPALDVLALIIGQGDSSRLSMKLRMDAPITNSIGAGTFTPKEGGLFTVSGTLNPEMMQQAFEGVKTEILRIMIEAPTGEELKKATTNLESEEFYAMETIEGIARKAGSLENLMGDYAYFQKFLKQVYGLKPEDLARVARKYMTPKTMNLVVMTPRNERESTKYLQGWMKAYAKEFTAVQKKKIVAGKKPIVKKVKWSMGAAAEAVKSLDKHRLPSGATVIFRPNHATPVFSAKAAFLGGARIEDGAQPGVTELLSRVWTSGTGTMSESEIQDRIEKMAGGISAFSGRNSTGLSMQTISPFEDESLEIFEEVLVAPVVSSSALDREKVMMLEAIRSREDSPGQLVSQLFMESMFKGHPYSRDLYGDAATVNKLVQKDVESYYRKVAMAKNLTVVVSGGVDKNKWLKRLETATTRMPKGESLKTSFTHKGPTSNDKQFKRLEREQSHIIIGYKGLTLTDPRRYTLQIIQSILAGQGGRLFLELRDKASLAYSVSPMRMEGIDTGYFGAYIGCSPGKGEKAIEMLQAEFAKLAEKEVPEAELDRAKRYLIGRHDIDLQRNSAISSSILFNEIYGIEGEEIFKYADHLRDISASEVRTLAKELFAQPYVLCAVGSQQPW
jgi:zinc protease